MFFYAETKERKKSMRRFLQAVFFLTMVCLWLGGHEVAAASPSGIVQTGADKTSVRLQWDAVDGAKYYGYEVALDPAFSNVLKTAKKASSSKKQISTTITSLEPGSDYYVRIGWGETGNACFRDPSQGIHVVTTPEPVANLHIAAADAKTVTLKWDPLPGTVQYRIRYNGKEYISQSDSCVLKVAKKSNGRAEVTSFKVSETGYEAESRIERRVSGIAALTPKISRKKIRVVKQYPASGTAYIKADCKGTGYEVKAVPVLGKKKKCVADGTVRTNPGVRLSGLKKGTMYRYRVRAYIRRQDGTRLYGKWSEYGLLCVPKVTYKASSGSISLQWGKLKGVSKVKLMVSKKADSGFRTSMVADGTEKGCVLSRYGKEPLERGTTYYIKVIPMAELGGKETASDAVEAFRVRTRYR